jgi:RNA polymerase sigma-70 factor (TIGR02943 family)
MMCSQSSKPGLSNPTDWLDLHGDALYSFAHRYVRNRAQAEDLVQETLLAALKSQAAFQGRCAEQSWFIAILKNKIKDHFRKRAREAIYDLNDFIPSGPDQGSWHPARRPACWMIDPDDPSEQQEFWEYLRQCLACLDARHAQVFVLREIHGLEYDDLCDVLQLSAANLRVMLFRARAQLRRCLETRWIQSRKDRRKTTAGGSGS